MNFELLLENNELDEGNTIIDRIFDRYGYGFKMWVPISIFFIACIFEGIIMTFISYLVIPLKGLYNLTDFQIQLISTILFIGEGIGSFISGYITSKYSRAAILKIVLFSLFILHFMMGLIQTISVFCLFRFLIGILNGIQLPLAQNLLTEYLPIRLRAFVISTCMVGFTVGTLTIPISMLFTMPNLEYNGIGRTIVVSAVIQFVLFYYVASSVEDSPRDLILKDKEEEAFKILEVFHGKQLREESKRKIIIQVKSGLIRESGNLSEIFNERFMKTSILLSFVVAICSITFYGPQFVSSLTLKSLGPKVKETNHEIILSQIYINLPQFVMGIFPGIMAEIKTLGRKLTIIIGFSFSAVFYVMSSLFPCNFSLYLGLSIGFLNISFVISGIYPSEVYPTKIRDTALGYIFFFVRIGGIISQMIYIMLNQYYLFLPYYLSAFLLAIGVVLVWFLPYETHDKPLDYYNSEKSLLPILSSIK